MSVESVWHSWVQSLKDWKKVPNYPLWGGIAAMMGLLALGLLMGQGSDHPCVLFTDLDLSESAKITSKLESLSIPFEIRAEGQQILVNSEDTARARMLLAEEGLPTGGIVGYELFDKSETFGATSFVQKVNHTRALEGELARSIITLNPVARARVHLVMPPKSLFSSEQQNPSSSVVLKLKNGMRLKGSQIQAIQNLVAGAVPDLSVENVTIVDDQGTLLTFAQGGDTRNGATRNLEELRVGQEARLAHNLETLLARTVGIGKVRVEVSIDMDFDRFSENKEIFDPEGQVVRSQQIIEDGANSAENPDKTRGVTVENALPHDDRNRNLLSASASVSQTKKMEEILNYEISRTTQTLVREAGVIRRVSVAVLVDGVYQKQNGAQDMTYSPRTKQELDQLKTLVKSAIGFRGDRGDTVEVVNLRFAREDMSEGGTDLVAPSEESGYPLWILVLVLLILLLLVLWPSIFEKEKAIPAGERVLETGALPESLEEDLARRVRELIDRDPETAAAIIENWLQQDA
ncbi:MAG: flagellar M-ring protein FliF [Holosporales bacterium]|nr:flagellar M-ring protein FliF [Holosporales bacterium]